MIDVPAAVEVDQRLQGDLSGGVGGRGCRGKLLCERVVRVYVGLVVFAVVELHDLAGDGRLESAIVIYGEVRCSIERLKGG